MSPAVALVLQGGFPARAGMDPTSDDRRDDYGMASPRAPDDPIRQHATSCKLLAARGWTVSPAVALVLQGGFPARAGMDPTSDDRRDDYGMASPRARGWTAAALLPAAHSDGFPARAGMDLRPVWRRPALRGVPRARGDGPHVPDARPERNQGSPRARGWTLQIRDRGLELAGMDGPTRRE